MSVYNGMPYLPEAVDSIVNQTLKDFKFLIINDGSMDGTEDYLNRLTDQRIQVVHQTNQGQGAARTLGINMCDSEFVAITDADDVALPTRLEAQLRFLRSHIDTGLLGTQVSYLGTGGRKGFSPPLPCGHEAIYADLLSGRHAICNPSIMCRTATLTRVGGYKIKGSGEDLDMWLRMGEVSRLANLNEVLHLYRLHLLSASIRQLVMIHVRYSHACDCARRRAGGQPEITFDEFLIEQTARPFWQRAAEVMDVHALGQYRGALAEILGSHRFRGYARLSWAAMCSPRLTSQRIARTIRNVEKR
jgi:glycosyltransferase involved in cell wall biosynthesis